MKQRMAYLFIGMLAAIHLLTAFSDREFKRALGEQIVCAVRYYEDKAYYLYLKYSGQIPPEIVLRHRDEWNRFEIFCDALLLERDASQELFEKYVSFVRSVNTRNVMRPRQRRRRWVTSNWFAERQKRQEKIVTAFSSEIESDFSPGEIDLMKEILMQTYVLPDADLRALRGVNLTDAQRDSLRPFVVRLLRSSIAYSPKVPGDEFNRDEKERLETDRRAFLTQASGILSKKQKDRWRSLREKALESVRQYFDRIDRMKRFMKLREEELKNERERNPLFPQELSNDLVLPNRDQSTSG